MLGERFANTFKMGTRTFPQMSRWKLANVIRMLDKYIGRPRYTEWPWTQQQTKTAYVTSGVSIPLAMYVQAVGKRNKPWNRGCVGERVGGKWKRERERERLLHIGAGLISSTRLTSHLFGSICSVQIFSVPQQWALPRQKIKTQEQNAGGRKELWH